MPSQNRVTPFGKIITVADRGMFMGNRGTLHDAHGQLSSQGWTRNAWVTCRLSFNGRQRQIMAPGKYTELFFLDEATALAAGHRPCATCRRDDYSRFKQLWIKVNASSTGMDNPSIQDIDKQLHHERFISGGLQDGWRPSLKDLPDGTFIVLDDPGAAWLVYGDALLEWSPGGYLSRRQWPDGKVTVLTPCSIVAVLAAGYVPELHPSADTELGWKNTPSENVAPVRLIPESPKPDFKASPPKSGKTKPELNTGVTDGTLYKLKKTPGGNALYTYFAAILKVTGMDQGKVYPLKKFLSNISGHEKKGRLQKVSGGYRLTRTGIDYFNDRYNPGSHQHIERSDVEALKRLIRNGGGPDWLPID